MGLNEEQKAAVEYLSGPLLVIAGPGTGKTQLLSAKVRYILEHEQTNAENILCVTYTESGAENMRERLGSMIGVASSDVNIFTYHALGANIIERYKNYATDFDRQLDAAIDSVMQYKIIKEIQSNLPFNDILKTASPAEIAETIQHAKSARLSPEDLLKIAEQNSLDAAEIATEITPILGAQKSWPRKFAERLERVYQPILEIFASKISAEPIVGNIERIANVMLREFKGILDEESAKEKPSVSPAKKWLDRYFESADGTNYRVHDYVANKKLVSLAHIMQQYNDRLKAEGLFDFADMIEEAIRILKTDDGFRATLTERFNYILLDEFQDTNPSQFEIIRLLTDYEKPIVMAVGDDDQAICEFQGANSSNLLTFQNYYQAEVITLIKNYRSNGRILDFSHLVADEIEESFAKKHHIDKTLVSMLDKQREEAGIKAPSEISRHEFACSSDEYYFVAERIAELIKAGEKPSDIAVIAPQHKFIGPLVPYLKARDIEVAYERRENLLEDETIYQIMTIADFCHDLALEKQPAHRLLEILSYDFWQIDALKALEAVHRAREERKSTLSYLAESSDEKFQQIAKFLADLALQSFDAPLEKWLDFLLGRLEINGSRSELLAYNKQNLSEAALFEFYENLNAIKKTVQAHVKNPRPKLADLIQTVHDYEEAGAAMMKVSLYKDADSAVQLMSVHKSKGLEFKYVFMVSVDDLAWGKSKGNNNKTVLPMNLRGIRHTGSTDDEKLRLLFVAITRAKDFLIMTNSKVDFNDKKLARLKYLHEIRDDHPENDLSPFLNGKERAIIIHDNDFDFATRIESHERTWSAAYMTLRPEIETLFKARLENYRLNATDLTDFIDLMYAGPGRIFEKCLMQAPDEPLTTQLAYGILVHAVLEQVTKSGISDDQAAEFLLEKTAELPLMDAEIAELAEKGKYSLNIVLKEFGEILRSPSARAEVNFSAEHLHFDEVPITGKIDHLEIDEKAKTIEVFDFKTGKFHDGKWTDHVTLYKYYLQLLFYKTLLNTSPTYRGYTVTRGHILYVSPDSEGLVHDRVLEFQEADDLLCHQLIKSIYHEIKTLDFIKNPEINLTADAKSHSKADVMAFARKLADLASELP